MNKQFTKPKVQHINSLRPQQAQRSVSSKPQRYTQQQTDLLSKKLESLKFHFKETQQSTPLSVKSTAEKTGILGDVNEYQKLDKD